jgi:hypothetical protein
MTLPASGPLTFAQIQTEFGGTNPIGLNEYYRGGALVPNGPPQNAAIPTSGAISLNQFYGATRAFLFTATISGSINNYNLSNAATAAGWNGVIPLIANITINSGVVVGSTSSTTAAFIVGSYAAGSSVNVTNNGVISGLGGRGGRAGSGGANANGLTGGTAFQISYPTTLTNNNIISGGGGGGGVGGDVIASFCQGTGGGAGGTGGNAILMNANLTLVNNSLIAAGGGGGGAGASYKTGDANGSFSAGGGSGGGGQGWSGGGRGYLSDGFPTSGGCSFGFFPAAPRDGAVGGDGSYAGPGGGGAGGFNGSIGGSGGAGAGGGGFAAAGGTGQNVSSAEGFFLSGGGGGGGGLAISRPSGTLSIVTLGTIIGGY